jgi:hypothetical protein
MALNFGVLDQGGPSNFFEGYSQGQEKMQANAMAQQRAAQAQQEFGMRQQEFAAGQADKRRVADSAIVTQRTLAARDALLRAPNPEAARAIVRAQHADPYLGRIRQQFGTLEQDLADIPEEASAFQQYKEREAMGVDEFLKRQASTREFAAAMGGAQQAMPQANAMSPAAPAPMANAMVAPAAPTNAMVAPAVSGELQTKLAQLQRLSTLANQTPQVKAAIDQLNKDVARLSPAAAAPSPLARLQSELAAMPPGDPRRADYLAAIKKETTPVAGTTVNVSTEKAYGGAFGGKLAEADIGKLATAEKAPQLADSANRIIDIVNKGDVFTGPAADIKLNIARALNVAGANNQDKIANTESLIAAAGQSTLDAIKSAGLGTGQGFTDKDLKFLQGIAGGTINLTSQTLTNLATLQHRAASRGAESWNKRVKEMPQEVVRGTGLSTAPIQISPLSTSRSAGNVVVTPDGQSHTFPTPAAAAQFKKAAGL